MSSIFTVISSLLVIIMLLRWITRYGTSVRDKWLGIAALLLWTIVTAAMGASGVLTDFSTMPPPFAPFLLAVLLTALVAAASPWGGRLANATPMRVLIGMQAFRFLPEALLDLAWRDGVAPIQMTFHGRNADLITAIVATALAIAWPRLVQQRRWAKGFSILGLALLANIVTIAVLSTPMPFRLFMNEPANTFVTHFPYVWLPGIHVWTALFLHVLLLRQLWRKRPEHS